MASLHLCVFIWKNSILGVLAFGCTGRRSVILQLEAANAVCTLRSRRPRRERRAGLSTTGERGLSGLQGCEKELNYTVRNSKVVKLQSTTSSGFGLKNLEKRLHLHYPDRHQLEIEERDDYFKIQLKIQMT